MIDYYLRTADAETMHAVLDGMPETVTVDIIGSVYVGDEPVPGYHANVRSEDPIEWPAEIESLEPDPPYRVFA